MYRHNVYSTGWLNSYRPADQDFEPARQGLGAFLARTAIRLVLGLASWVEKRRVRSELMAMDDRELADIGLVRTDIERVAEGRFEGLRESPKKPSLPREGAGFSPRLAA